MTMYLILRAEEYRRPKPSSSSGSSSSEEHNAKKPSKKRDKKVKPSKPEYDTAPKRPKARLDSEDYYQPKKNALKPSRSDKKIPKDLLPPTSPDRHKQKPEHSRPTLIPDSKFTPTMTPDQSLVEKKPIKHSDPFTSSFEDRSFVVEIEDSSGILTLL